MPRILEQLRITEVASVDKGAGEGVKVLIMKRDGGSDVTPESLYDFAKSDALPDAALEYLKRSFTTDQRRAAETSGAAMSGGGYPIENATDLHNAIAAIGRGKAPHASIKQHIIRRARALGLTGALPDDWKVKKGLVRKLLEAIGIAKATDFETAQADVETGEYAQDMLEEFGEAINALGASIASIMCDEGVTDKKGAVDATLAQFQAHIQGVVPEGIEQAMRGAALAAAGYEINDQGAISKRAEPMTKDDLATAIAKMSGQHARFAEKLPEGERRGFALMSDTQRDAHMKDHPATKEGAEEPAEKKLAKALRELAVLKMSDKHKGYVAARGNTMSPEEKDKFADMEPGERDAHMEKNPVAEDTEKRIAEEVAKRVAADPTVVSMQKRIEELTKRDELVGFEKRATELGLGATGAVTLQKAYAGDKAAIDTLLQKIGASTEQARAAGFFKEFGGSGAETGATAHDEIMAKAQELRKADPKLTIEQAYAKAYQDPANHDIAKRDRVAARARMGAAA